MIHCIISKDVVLQFHETGNGDFLPKLIQKEDAIDLSLLVMEHDIHNITHKLKVINFYNLPHDYIKMIISGCIVIVLKNSKRSTV